MRLLKTTETLRHCGRRENVYIQTLTDLIKASWILVDVIAKHPQRPYITSGHRQMPIAMLAADISSELELLRSIGFSKPTAEDLLHKGDHTILIPPPHKQLEGVHRKLQDWGYLQPVPNPVPAFRYFGEIKVEETQQRIECSISLTYAADRSTFYIGIMCLLLRKLLRGDTSRLGWG